MSILVVRRPTRSAVDAPVEGSDGKGVLAGPADPGSSDAGPRAVTVVAPPRQGESMPMAGSMGMILVPAASGIGAVLLAVTHQDRPLLAAAGLLVLAASITVGVVMVIGSRTGERRRTREQRERYLDHLEQVRQQGRQAAERQRVAAARSHPDPRDAAAMAWSNERRWERRPVDNDFLHLRAGRGTVPLDHPVRVRTDDDPLTAYDPVCQAAARELAAQYSVLPDQPIWLPLGRVRSTSIVGATGRVRSVVRALLAQLIWAHSPADVGVLLYCPDGPEPWEWLKWVPHNLSADTRDGPLPTRLITDDLGQAIDMLADGAAAASIGPAGPCRLVVVVDALAAAAPVAGLPELIDAAGAVRASVLCLTPERRYEPERVDLRVLLGVAAGPPGVGAPEPNGTGCEFGSIGSATSGLIGPAAPGPNATAVPGPISPAGPDLIELRDGQAGQRMSRCRLDELDLASADLLARSFAPLRAARDVRGSSGNKSDNAHPLHPDQLAALDPVLAWRPRRLADLLRVPIGKAPNGDPVLLDLKESALGGAGPHGLVVGATGSGKSELLRTLVTALAATHPPDSLALLLADFKGGATFSGLAKLPHVAGMITNLEADQSLIDRFRDALGGELHGRQELLAAAGATSLDQYLQVRRGRPETLQLPRLLVIIDEFSELLGARPDLAELFVTIGRIGRSIGIHLLLATQRLETGRIRGLESHLSYRICLRTFSEAESREVVGSPVAHHLPAEPGWGYLRCGEPELSRFRALTVSVPFRPPAPVTRPPLRLILPFQAQNGTAQRLAELYDSHWTAARFAGGGISRQVQPGHADSAAGSTVLDVAVQRLCDRGPLAPGGRPARRIWLEPLPPRITLGDLPRHGAARSAAVGGICAVLGLVDVPERQRQQPLEWDFSRGNANLLVIGAGRSGKSTAAAALVASLAVAYSPGDVEIAGVDFGGGALAALAGLPQVSAVGTRSDPELTRRVFTRLTALLGEREELFRRERFDSVGAFRRARADGTVQSALSGDVVLVIDGWSGVRDSDPDVEGLLEEILSRGPGVGVHTVLTAAAGHQVRTRLTVGFAGRIELRLSDSFDSAIDRQLAKSIPADRPGRALVPGRHFAQIAVPVLAPTAGAGGDDASSATGAGLGTGSSTDAADEASSAASSAAGAGAAAADAAPGAGLLVAAIRARWPGQSVPRLRTLPTMVSLADVQSTESMTKTAREPARAGGPALLLGLAESDLMPVRHDLGGTDPHLIILGDPGSGKTTMLRTLLEQLTPTDPPPSQDGVVLDEEEAAHQDRSGSEPVSGRHPRVTDRVVVVDYRRALLASSRPGVRLARTASEAAAACADLAADLAGRLAGRAPTVDSDGHRQGSPDAAATDSTADPSAPIAASSSTRTCLVVDDYDMVNTNAGDPLAVLLPFLPLGRDIGFHLLLARRAGGAARAQFEPFLQTLGDLGTPVMVFSGPPTEGRLSHGVVPQRLPPGRARYATRSGTPQLIQAAWTGGAGGA